MMNIKSSSKGQKKKITSKQGLPERGEGKGIRFFNLLGLLIILFLGILIYSNSFNCEFNFDDSGNIVHNMAIRNLLDVKAWWNFNPNRPVAYFSFALNYHFNQLDVWYWHFVNLAIHLVNAGLVYWLTRLIFSSPVMKESPLARNAKGIALFTALLFVSHPLATESVTYIVQRLASLMTLFYLLTLAFYIKARLPGTANTVKYLLFTGAFLSALLALFTKENAYTLPIAMVLVEVFFLQAKKLSVNFKDYRMIMLMAVFPVLLVIISMKFSFNIFKSLPPAQVNTFAITPVTYFFTQCSVIIKYIQLLILPLHQNLDYDVRIANSFFESKTFLSFVLLLLLFLSSFFLFKKQRIISFGIIWFFLTLSIESSFIPLDDLIFEHRTYLPSYGFFLILSSGIYGLLWGKFRYPAIALFVIIIGANSFLTYKRNMVWKDRLTLWTDAVSKAPGKSRPNNNLGDAYGALGQWEKAMPYFSRAIEISPNYTGAYYNRGVAALQLEKWSQAKDDFTKVIELNPKHAKAFSHRGTAYRNLGALENAIADYTSAIGIDPGYVTAYFNRAIAYLQQGQEAKSIEDFSTAIKIDPKFAEVGDAYSNRGVAYSRLGQVDKAIADFSKAIEIAPRHPDAYSNRGFCYDKLGQWDKAIDDYTKAIEINPKNAMAYFNRGSGYGNLGKWEEAMADFSRAIEINPDFTSAKTNRDIAYSKLRSGQKK